GNGPLRAVKPCRCGRRARGLGGEGHAIADCSASCPSALTAEIVSKTVGRLTTPPRTRPRRKENTSRPGLDGRPRPACHGRGSKRFASRVVPGQVVNHAKTCCEQQTPL